MKEIWLTRWQQLAPRERRVISWGGAGLLAAVLYAYLWQPITEERHKLRANLPQLRETAAQMQRQAQEAGLLGASVAPTPQGEAFKSAIHREMRETSFDGKTAQIDMLDENRASIILAAISFDAWVALLAGLQKGQGIRLESCSIQALPEAGMVSVRAVLTAGGQL